MEKFGCSSVETCVGCLLLYGETDLGNQLLFLTKSLVVVDPYSKAELINKAKIWNHTMADISPGFWDKLSSDSFAYNRCFPEPWLQICQRLKGISDIGVWQFAETEQNNYVDGGKVD
ncbi:hypothetical protein EJ110_NYTH14062 [Nymphaea thermarum]|nr:hypothetical protein EJ110_NYTH14062 [Nymphaea thermarum]